MKKDIFKLCLDALNFSICKDETRKNLVYGVHHNEEMQAAISTTGHTMAVCSLFYEENLKGMTIDTKYHRLVRGEFPRANMFRLPTKDVETREVYFEKKFYVKSKLPTPLFLYSDGSLSFEYLSHKTLARKFDSNFIKPLVGHKLEVVFSENKVSAFYVKLKGESNYFVVMPLKLMDGEV